ncbi:MAG: helix-turn-helix domain-containing protein [Clostridiales Family XIII bacterium]|jgi:transcriptional regulator with XRE-family HTH domain|nr:helix-turn-helix domain-containing protein [Clostridiales Family XIII bacterium]
MIDLDWVTIGERIRKQRTFLGYSRDYIADQIDVSTNFCRDIEIGAKGMSVSTLVRLADVLKISTDYIVFGKTVSADKYSPLIVMIDSIPEDKQSYAVELMKVFIQSLD